MAKPPNPVSARSIVYWPGDLHAPTRVVGPLGIYRLPTETRVSVVAHIEPAEINDHQKRGKRERNKVHVPKPQSQVVNSNKFTKRKR